jgi:hypothetical protein
MRGFSGSEVSYARRCSLKLCFNAVFATLVLKHSLALSGAKPNTLFHLIPAQRHSQTVVWHFLDEMIEFTKEEIDNIDFIRKVQTLANEFITILNPKEIFLFKVDNWFDTKWLNFTGKVLGALGTWDYEHTQRIPPFSPNRIKQQSYFKKDNLGTYQKKEFEHKIHKRQPAEENLQRRIVNFSDSAVFIWYSSNTILNGQGSLMIYPVQNDKCEPFYVGLKKNKNWDIVNSPGSNRKTLEFILNRK